MAMDVCVLIFKGCSSLSSIGPMELLWTAGRLNGTEPFFNVRLVSAATNPLTSPTGLQEINRFDGVRLEERIWDAIEARLPDRRRRP